MYYLTYFLILVSVVMSLSAWNSKARYNKWIMSPFRVKNNGEYFRFITSGFIHHDYAHLIFNMIALFFFGRVIERYYVQYFDAWGYFFYALLFIAGVVIADIPTYRKYLKEPNYFSLGASGGVAAVLFSAIIIRPTSSICLYFALCVPAFVFGIAYLVYSWYQGKQMSDNVNHDAHLYGSLFGIIMTIALRPLWAVGFVLEIQEYILSFF